MRTKKPSIQDPKPDVSDHPTPTRRRALRTGVAVGVTSLFLPGQWTRPVVQSVTSDPQTARQDACPEAETGSEELDIVMDVEGVPHNVQTIVTLESGVVEVSDILVTPVT